MKTHKKQWIQGSLLIEDKRNDKAKFKKFNKPLMQVSGDSHHSLIEKKLNEMPI